MWVLGVRNPFCVVKGNVFLPLDIESCSVISARLDTRSFDLAYFLTLNFVLLQVKLCAVKL